MDIEKEIESIKERNRKVEAEKAWETSNFRMLLIAVVTYLLVSLVMYVIGVDNYFLNALVPTVGFLLSVQSVPAVKRWWIKRYLN